jgi:hypothetical protein
MVRLNRLGPVAFSISALVRRNRVKTRFRKGGQLMPPGVRQFRKSVKQKDQRAFARFMDMQVDTIGFNHPFFYCHHFSFKIIV